MRVLVDKKSPALETHEDSGRTGAKDLEDGSIRGQSVSKKSYLPRNSRCNGRAMGLADLPMGLIPRAFPVSSPFDLNP